MLGRFIISLYISDLFLVICGEQPSIQIHPEVARFGSRVKLDCMVKIDRAITFRLNGTFQGTCAAPIGDAINCEPGEILQNISGSITSWTKSSVNLSDIGLWTCEVFENPSNPEKLYIYEFPNDTLAEVGITSNIVVNETSLYPVQIEIACLFSEHAPSFNLQFMAEGLVHRSEPMTCKALTTGCSPCVGCSPYDCNHTISFHQALSSNQNKYFLQIEVGVTGNLNKFTQQVFAPFTVEFESTGKSSESLKTISAGEIAGIAVGAAAIVGIIGVITLFVINHMKGKGKKDVKS